MQLAPADILPADRDALLVGRLWVDGAHAGPRPVLLRGDSLIDLSTLAPTVSTLLELTQLPERLAAVDAPEVATLSNALAEERLLAPCDLQAIKAAGVTFAESTLERLIEERTRGAPDSGAELRQALTDTLGGPIADIEPGSAAAERARALLTDAGLWSQYLEVAIGPDAEVFTKAQPLSAVGCGALLGMHPASSWCCSEPEMVMVVSSAGRIVGATLGNDLTLRDYEGRSALLLGRAKDNNASCAVGPFIRLFDDGFDLESARAAEVTLTVQGSDGFRVSGVNSLAGISRAPEALVAATIGPCHQYPDGLLLFLGTMYVPAADRHGPGSGFTHEVGDRVSIASPRLGTLVNQVTTCDKAPAWTFGAGDLLRSLTARGL